MPPAPADIISRQARVMAADVVFGPFRSVQVNVDGANNNIVGDAANEPTIAIDPTRPNRIAICWRQFDSIASSFRQAGRAHSQNGGQSWTFPGSLSPGLFRSDPVLMSDADGVFYFSSLPSGTSVVVYKSLDQGVTWLPEVPAFGGDKQWIAVDRTSGIGRGNLYQIWNVQFSCCPPNDFTRSINEAASFQGPFAVPTPSMKWGTMDVGHDGTLHLAGSNLGQTGHLFTKSLNAQNPAVNPTFTPPQAIALGGVIPFGGASTPNPAGLMGQTWIATDHSSGATRGNIYVLQSLDPPGTDPMDIMFIRSTDGGNTWTAPRRVNDDPVGNNAWQWFGTMSVAPNGRIDVIWNDTRNTGSFRLSETRYTFSLNAGDTWSPSVVMTPVWDSHIGWPQQNKIGDYYHMISDNGGASLAYATTFNGEEDVYFLRIPRDCNSNGVEDPVDIAGGVSEDCNANAIPDECEPSADCNANGNPDMCDIAEHISADCDGNLVPDECETGACAPSPAPQLAVLGARNRYLSLEFGGPCRAQAVRVIFENLPSPYHVWNGASFWLTAPDEVSELSGNGAGDPAIAPTSWFAGLTCTGPAFLDWPSLGTVNVHHEGIVPGGLYRVQVIDAACPIIEANFSPALDVTNPRWGDMSGAFNVISQTWTGADGSVDVTVDATACLEKFRNSMSAPAKARADVEPRRTDLKISINDVTRILDAFRGLPYPFVPSTADPCDAS